MINVIFNGFYGDVLRQVIENITHQTAVGYIKVVHYEDQRLKNLRAEKAEFVKYHPLLHLDKSLCDPNDLIPIDEELVVKMASSQRIVMKMIDRLEVLRHYTYQQRLEMYYFYLRYWNTAIEKNRVNLFISANVPHEIFDYVIYGLCQVKKIPIIFLYHQSQIEDTALVMRDWRENSLELQKRFHELQQQYAGKSEAQIDLPSKLQRHFDAQVSNSAEAVPFYMDTQRNWPAKFRFITASTKNAYDLLRKNPGSFFLKIINPSSWVHFGGYIIFLIKYGWNRLKANIYTVYNNFYYQHHSISPDLSKKFIYVPLQYQPELSTSPLANVFADQQLIIQMLSKYLPPDVYLYVKEHPKQTSFCRSVKFYENLCQTKNVVLVPKDGNSFSLIQNSLAVATCTGTPGWEALFRHKPVLMFGSYIYQFADGVFKIATNADCQHALDQILKHQVKPSLKNMKLFLMALGEVSFPAVIDPDYLRVTKLTTAENIANITAALLTEINRLPLTEGYGA